MKTYDRIFDPDITGYNGAAGPILASVNIGPVQPPQRKGRVPQYSRNQLVELQTKFDELEQAQVFRGPLGSQHNRWVPQPFIPSQKALRRPQSSNIFRRRRTIQ